MADIKKVKWKIIMDYPFFAHLMQRVELVEDETVKTGSTDGRSINYNPTWFDTLTDGQGVFFVCHEIGHILGEHPFRLGGRDLSLANEAGDFAINSILKDFNMEMVENCLLDDRFQNQSFERIYDQLLDERQKQEQQQQEEEQQGDNEQPSGDDNSEGSGSGDESDTNDDSSSSDSSEDDEAGDDSGEGEGNDSSNDSDAGNEKSDSTDGNEKSDSTDGAEGDGADGEGEGSSSPKYADPNEMGGFHQPNDEEGRPLSAAEIATDQAEWKQAAAEALVAQKMGGYVPGSLKRFVNEVLDAQMNWREALRLFMQKAVRKGWSYDRPDRRYLHRDLILPGRSRKEKLPLLVAVDTSGSVGQREMDKFAAEISEILSTVPDVSEVEVIYCDTQIAHIETFTRDDFPITMAPHGGGGTNFRPPFEWAEKKQQEEGKRYSGLVYLTDLCCSSYPDTEPDFPVLWVSTYSLRWVTAPPFGEVAELID